MIPCESRDSFLAWFDGQMPDVRSEISSAFDGSMGLPENHDGLFPRYFGSDAGWPLIGKLLIVRAIIDFWFRDKFSEDGQDAREFWLREAERRMVEQGNLTARRGDWLQAEIQQHELISRQWLRAGTAWRHLRTTTLSDQALDDYFMLSEVHKGISG
jgi:hypothetical protein